MNVHGPSLLQGLLARLSLGFIPLNGHWWFDPRPDAPAPGADAGAHGHRPTARVPQPDWSPVGVSVARVFRRPRHECTQKESR
jgi:hypothetical protein